MRTERGILLIEILLIICLVMAAIVPTMDLIMHSGKTVEFNQERAVAQILASQVIERFRGESFEFLVDNFATDDGGTETIRKDFLLNLMAAHASGNHKRLYGRFTRTARFTEVIPGCMGTLECRLLWTDNGGSEKTYRMATVVRNGAYHHGK